MKVYFLETEDHNTLVFTNEEAAKVYEKAPYGKFENIDLYGETAIQELKEFFSRNDINTHDFVSGDDVSLEEIEGRLEDAVLIYEDVLDFREHLEDASSYLESGIIDREEILEDVRFVWKNEPYMNWLATPEEYTDMILEAIGHLKEKEVE